MLIYYQNISTWSGRPWEAPAHKSGAPLERNAKVPFLLLTLLGVFEGPIHFVWYLP